MAEGEVSLTVDDSALRRFVPEFLRRSRLVPAALRQSREERAAAIVEDLKAATPLGEESPEPGHEHARDGWALERHGADLAIATHVAHTYYLLHGNHPNAADGLIHPTGAQALHFYDGGSEVFARGVRPMHADPELVEAWDRAAHDARAWERLVAERVAGALSAALP